ncbi:unnamed protein product [Periconia digitata]|uniref:Uncharacterized protein n=1 Tax=Periconia digitata TaxID=1303443 RepID=A0A9W4XST9_9PLEO|nr:unnamed protein product [Periconia digitata]
MQANLNVLTFQNIFERETAEACPVSVPLLQSSLGILTKELQNNSSAVLLFLHLHFPSETLFLFI